MAIKTQLFPGFRGHLLAPKANESQDERLIQLEESILVDVTYLQQDLKRILRSAGLEEDFICLEVSSDSSSTNTARFSPFEDKIHLNVSSSKEEVASTFYYALHKLGFLFPHPRQQISPTREQIISKGNQSFVWKPSLETRGFHLHLQHPSEWVHGFLMGKREVAEDMIFWLARNMQNLMQIQMIRYDESKYQTHLRDMIELSQKMGVKVILSVSFAFIQQKSYKLIPIWAAVVGTGSRFFLRRRLKYFTDLYKPDGVTFELGTSEFTPTNFKRTLKWMNISSKFLEEKGLAMYTKVHCSIDQSKGDLKNFNYMPAQARNHVGVLPHTVMFYALDDKPAPVYERKDFQDLKDFMIEQNKVRPTLYYPETSYFIGFDIDVPILLTDYILARHKDLKLLKEHNVPGQVNFSTGHELGYWIIDWAYALTAVDEYKDNPLIAFELLGESVELWKEVFDFQHQYIKQKQLIQAITAPNFMDEVLFMEQVHKRKLLRQLKSDKEALKEELTSLSQAIDNLPNIEAIKNSELKALMSVTFSRIKHAYHLRKALAEPEKLDEHILNAQEVRLSAQKEIDYVMGAYDRYPEAHTFKRNENPTSYKYGYGFMASNLHFWERDERVVKENRWSPFFMNIYNIKEIVF